MNAGRMISDDHFLLVTGGVSKGQAVEWTSRPTHRVELDEALVRLNFQQRYRVLSIDGKLFTRLSEEDEAKVVSKLRGKLMLTGLRTLYHRVKEGRR